jgi:hypothetical protein
MLCRGTEKNKAETREIKEIVKWPIPSVVEYDLKRAELGEHIPRRAFSHT